MKILQNNDNILPIADDCQFKICFTACCCTAQIINVLSQIIQYYPASNLVVILDSGNNISGRAGALLPATSPIYCSGLFQLVNSQGVPQEAVSICKIAAISISGENYNNDIVYNPLLECPATGCEAYCESALQSILTIGSDVQIKAGGQTVAHGIVQIKKYGMVVVTDKNGHSPVFISTCKIESVK